MANKPNDRKRIEKDSLGRKSVPAAAYYGIETQRAVENFPISGLQGPRPSLVEACVRIKKAAALANARLGLLDRRTAAAIASACDEVAAGKLAGEFVVDVFQMGAGTSFHMNVNEVVANRAEELLGGRKGEYRLVRPHDHVNMAQSTNDVFPTAMRLASLALLRDRLVPALSPSRARSAGRPGLSTGSSSPAARTCRTRCRSASARSSRPTGGPSQSRGRPSPSPRAPSTSSASAAAPSAPGSTRTRASPASSSRAWPPKPGSRSGRPPTRSRPCRACVPSPISPPLSAIWPWSSTGSPTTCGSWRPGPRTGLAEISLPPVAPGSSIMPGKVNPSMLEMLNQVCYQVVGCDAAVSAAVQAGQLELNVMMPVVSFNLLFMIGILANAIRQTADRAIDGITADAERCRAFAEASAGLATALSPLIGYAAAAEVARESLRTGKSVVDVVRERGLLDEAALDRVLDPLAMTRPGIPASRPAPADEAARPRRRDPSRTGG